MLLNLYNNFPTKMYGPCMVENNIWTLTCITYLRLKVTTKPIAIGEEVWCLIMINGTKNNKLSHKHNIVHLIFTHPVGDH